MSWSPLDVLTERQQEQLSHYRELLLAFNRSLNLISRDDEAAVDEHHLLHCLALTHRRFPDGVSIVDWGTGGGLPAIPLAIACPGVTVHAVDAVDKKIHAVRTMVRRLGLTNVVPWSGRAERWPGRTVYSVSRATAPLADLWTWHRAARMPASELSGEDVWQPGLVCLKGGDLGQEVAALQRLYPSVAVRPHALSSMVGLPYFAEKYVLEVYEVAPEAS